MKLNRQNTPSIVQVLSTVDGQNGSLKSGDNYVWRDEKASFTIKSTGNSNPTIGEYLPGFTGLIFSGTSMNQVWIDFHIDHDIALGTKIYPHVHWMPLTNTAGTVRWGFQYIIAKGHGQAAFPTESTTVYVNHAFTSGKQYFHMVTEVPEIDAILSSEVEPDSVIKMRIFRDAVNDSHNENIHAWQADLHYQVARIGTINKAPNFFGS